MAMLTMHNITSSHCCVVPMSYVSLISKFENMHCGTNILAQEICKICSLKFTWRVIKVISHPQNSIGVSKESVTSPKTQCGNFTYE